MGNSQFKNFLYTTPDLFSFVHRTNSPDICKRIINEGFLFADSFHKTTDRLINDEIYLNYWNLQRKHYGEFVIRIDFSKELINALQVKFQSVLQSKDVQQFLAEDLGQNEEDENIFLLPLFYIKGYYDINKNIEVLNPFYNPSFVPLKLLKELKK